MKTLVGLFESASTAQRAVDELKANGFSSSQIHMVESKNGMGSVQGLAESIGEPDIRFYEEGLRRGGMLLVVDADDSNARMAAEILNRFETVNVDQRSAEYGEQYRVRDYNENDIVLPVVEEEIQIGKRAVERGRMRVYSRVTERPVEEQVNLREERVKVERRPVNREVTSADMDSMRDQSFEVTAMAEEAVVAKRARVIEEVVVDKEVIEHTETIRDTVRRTDVQVEEGVATTGTNTTTRATATSASSTMSGATATGATASNIAAFDTYDSDFRSYYTSNLGKSGYTYDEYSPVFRYGYSLANDKRYSGKNWTDVETDARRSWEERNPGTWEQFKDSVRYAWDKVTGKRA